jgi:Ca2+-binding EF-hand superfamily protein
MSKLIPSLFIVLAGLVPVLPLQAAPERVGMFDLDGDGRITRTEFVTGRSQRFTAIDRNSDQVVSAADFPAGTQAMLLDRRVDKVIAAADLNHDGEVTRLELGLAGTPLFDRADVDGNGIVESKEIARFKAQLGPVIAKSGHP